MICVARLDCVQTLWGEGERERKRQLVLAIVIRPLEKPTWAIDGHWMGIGGHLDWSDRRTLSR